MSPFWSSLWQELKHYGRSSTLFMLLLPALVAIGVLADRIPERFWGESLPYCGAGILLLIAVTIYRARRRRHDRSAHPPLSEDEWRAARTKLKARGRAP